MTDRRAFTFSLPSPLSFRILSLHSILSWLMAWHMSMTASISILVFWSNMIFSYLATVSFNSSVAISRSLLKQEVIVYMGDGGSFSFYHFSLLRFNVLYLLDVFGGQCVQLVVEDVVEIVAENKVTSRHFVLELRQHVRRNFSSFFFDPQTALFSHLKIRRLDQVLKQSHQITGCPVLDIRDVREGRPQTHVEAFFEVFH